MRIKDTSHVMKHCANYTAGYICLGGMINSQLQQWLDDDLYNKPCLIKEGKECEYFDKFVKPIIN